jgi:hypothetical protein
MLVKHVSERPRPVRERRPEVPAYLAVAIDRALAKRPEDRWSDAAEFRDALDAAKASSRYRPPPALPPLPALAPSPAQHPPAAPQAFPSPPPGLSRQELKHWYRAQRRQSEMVIRGQIDAARHSSDYDERPIEDRVIAFRRSVVSWLAFTPVFFVANMATHGFPWFFIPSAAMFFEVLRKEFAPSCVRSTPSRWADTRRRSRRHDRRSNSRPSSRRRTCSPVRMARPCAARRPTGR